MKKIVTYTFVGALAFVVLGSFTGVKFGKRDGTEPGFTGSPGDSLKNCTVCHGGTAVDVDGWITSTVPQTGFVAGQRYTIKATNTEIGATRFGFSVSPQALNGDLLGTLLITDTTKTKLVGNDKYVTYRADGVQGIDSLSWTFDWIAPANINEVIFYGAFNSNHEGHKDGDKTYLSRLRLYKEGFVGLTENIKNDFLSVYPNPAIDEVSVKTAHNIQSGTVTVYDINGKLVLKQIVNGNNTINVQNLTKGIYHIMLSLENGNSYATKMVKL
jgi:hypothetical protein